MTATCGWPHILEYYIAEAKPDWFLWLLYAETMSQSAISHKKPDYRTGIRRPQVVIRCSSVRFQSASTLHATYERQTNQVLISYYSKLRHQNPCWRSILPALWRLVRTRCSAGQADIRACHHVIQLSTCEYAIIHVHLLVSTMSGQPFLCTDHGAAERHTLICLHCLRWWLPMCWCILFHLRCEAVLRVIYWVKFVLRD